MSEHDWVKAHGDISTCSRCGAVTQTDGSYDDFDCPGLDVPASCNLCHCCGERKHEFVEADVIRLEAELARLKEQLKAAADFPQLLDACREIARLRHERNLHVELSESLKLALRMPGTGNYIEWARECRAAVDELARLRADLQGLHKLQRLLYEIQEAIGGKPGPYPDQLPSMVRTLRAEVLDLTEAIVAVAIRCGITPGTMPLTGPHVFLLARIAALTEVANAAEDYCANGGKDGRYTRLISGLSSLTAPNAVKGKP